MPLKGEKRERERERAGDKKDSGKRQREMESHHIQRG